MVGRMNEGPGAEIIRFPGRLRLSVDLATRLVEAIRALDQANTKLGDEFPDLQNATKALTVSLREIAESLQVLDTGLTTASSPMKVGVRKPCPD